MSTTPSQPLHCPDVESKLYPTFSSLPLTSSGPRGNAWGLFPPSPDTNSPDELGMLNHLTPLTTLAAAREIQHGIRISTDWVMDEPKVPCFGRRAFEQRIVNKHPRTVNDDVLEFNTQGGSQWDGFRHFGYQDHKVFYNGCTQHDVENSKRNGIHVWVKNGGIVGRGVLLDYARWAKSQGKEFDPLTTHQITAGDLTAIASSQGVTFHTGDILFVHTNFLNTFRSLPPSSAAAFAAVNPPSAIGLRAGKEELEWVWEKRFAAVATDCPAFEALPFQSQEFWIHEWFLAGWGLPIGELFDLERLSKECAEKEKWSFWFSSMPLNVPGGVASPPNGVAIL